MLAWVLYVFKCTLRNMPVCGTIMVAKNGPQYTLLHVIFPVLCAMFYFVHVLCCFYFYVYFDST